MKALLLLLLCQVSSPVKHRLVLMATACSGVPSLPEFFANLVIDEMGVGYCDSNRRSSDSVSENQSPEVDTSIFKSYIGLCFENLPNMFKVKLNNIKEVTQTEAVHVLQIMTGCEWNEKTGEVQESKGLKQVSGNQLMMSEGLLWRFLQDDSSRQGLTVLKPSAQAPLDHTGAQFSCTVNTDTEAAGLVSLLQKSPSSRVSCHATGFRPDRAVMFWRRHSEAVDPNAEQSEILPNPDGTFQVKSDLNVSLIPLEEWESYDCMFQASGFEQIRTRLSKATIRTNRISASEAPHGAVVGIVIGLLMMSATCIAGFLFYRKKNNIAVFRGRNTNPESREEMQDQTEAQSLSPRVEISDRENPEKGN